MNVLFEYLELPRAIDLEYQSVELDGIGFMGKAGILDVMVNSIRNLQFYDTHKKAELPDNKMNIITIELPKLSSFLEKRGEVSGIACWSAFFRHREEDKLLSKGYKPTMKAEDVLEKKRRDDDFMTAYREARLIIDDEESRLKTYAYNRYMQGIEHGSEQGKAEAKKELVQKLKKKGLSQREIEDLLD